ncbi:MAG: T9SS type A sorting domain-containing protein [Sporocytophaga sp.]|uniref:GDSL-type esterase/lipase family protein n=1 Tax=Sporocytophaga sp. TaxID=2231183 RepID=UPI001B07F328|nr:GDSL-type esterase/lipase family protein [Sporocytophaga sp.]MBO9700104.1 T9SS type A sorting domain-containing protein [Sporocytophaga sp.]
MKGLLLRIIKDSKLAILISLTFVSISAYSREINKLSYDKKIKAFIAPEACHYQWFFNGQRLSAEDRQVLKASATGEYSVQLIDEEGVSTYQKVLLAVDATGAVITIYLIGDSTVCNYAASAYPMTGWGQMLPYFFNSTNVKIDNRAIGGRSSRSFYEEGRWTTVKNALTAGDYLFIQFGHNDRDFSKTERYTSVEDYKKFLTIYVNESRAKGAIPVLISPMVMNAWSNGTLRNVFTETGNNYRGGMLEVATALNVPFIDLNMKSWNLFKGLGQNYITRFVYHTYPAGEYPNYRDGITDGTHFQEMGAIENARMIVQGISELTGNINMSSLAKFLKPMYEIKVLVNPVGSDLMTTRTASYPEGLTVTLKTLPKTGSTFQLWKSSAGGQVSTVTLTTVKSGTTATNYTAIYKGATTTCSAIISASGATTFCEGGSVTLTSSVGSSYLWKNGTTQVATTQTYVAKTSGNYTVEVTDANGCKAVAAATNVTIQNKTIWYADADGDGKGDSKVAQSSCTQPTGYVADKTDLCPEDKNKTEPGNCGCGRTESSCMDCANVLNGTATLDVCGVCIGGNTGKKSCVYKLQAEEACEVDGVLNESTNAGFEGTGYVNAENAIGKSASFSFDATASGYYKLLIRYANGGAANRSSGVTVNSIEQSSVLAFPSTGAFTAWSTLEAEVFLNEGNNIVRLIARTVDGLPNIDFIGFTENAIAAGPCLVTGIDMGNINSTEGVCYPNPFTGAFTLQAPQEYSYAIYDLTGKEVESGKGLNTGFAGNELLPGIYTVKLQTLKSTRSLLIIKR